MTSEELERRTQDILDGIVRRLLDEREAENDPTNEQRPGDQGAVETLIDANCGGADASG